MTEPIISVPQNRLAWLRRHRIVSLLLLNAVILCALLIAFEIVLRVRPPGWLRARMTSLSAASEQATEVGSDVGWPLETNKVGAIIRFLPNSSFAAINAEYQHRILIDEFGGRKVLAKNWKPTASTGRLLYCWGDSFTFGVGVKEEDSFVSLLQEDVSARVLNLGIPGSCLTEQLNRFSSIVDAKPGEYGDQVFFVYLGNDLSDLIGMKQKRSTTPSSPDSGSMSMLSWANSLTHRQPFKRSYAVQFTKASALKILNSKSAARIEDSKLTSMRSSEHAFLGECAKELRVQLERLKMLSDGRFNPIFVLIPHKYQLDDEQRKQFAGYYGLDPSELDPLLPNRIVRRNLEEIGFKFIDPTEAMRGNAASLYFQLDDHFTSEGHRRFYSAIREPLIAALAASSEKSTRP